MYGDLIHLKGDRSVGATWHRVPLGSQGHEGAVSEARLQEILFQHADILPIGEIDPAYYPAIPVCRELGTPAGPADALYLTPTGRIVLAEFKLWRNPEARREVIGQILDYAAELALWSYSDLEREVRQRADRSPFEIVSQAHGNMSEQAFVDRVTRHIKRGEFLLLIIGDGIREGVERIADYVQEHSGLRFNLALIEAAVFRRGDSADLMVQPRVLARTELLPRTILLRRTVLEETDDDPLEEAEPLPIEDENERFWQAVLRDFAFDDREVKAPQPSRTAWLHVRVKDSGHGGWGLWFEVHLDRKRSQVSVYLSGRTGTPGERIFPRIVGALQESGALAGKLSEWEEWTYAGQRPRLGLRRPTSFLESGEVADFDDAVAWTREHFNRFVSTLHPECRRRLAIRR